MIDLRGVRCVSLRDDPNQWPRKNRLQLDGIQFEEIEMDLTQAPVHLRKLPFDDMRSLQARMRLHWLKLQKPFDPSNKIALQPFEQVRRAYERSGLYQQAEFIDTHRIGMQVQSYNWLTRWPDRILRGTVSYLVFKHGYEPQRAVGWWVLLVASGALVFSQVDAQTPAFSDKGESQQQADSIEAGVVPSRDQAIKREDNAEACMVPAEEEFYVSYSMVPPTDDQHASSWLGDGYPKYNSIVYAIDVALPIVELEQQRYWIPSSDKSCSIEFQLPMFGEVSIPYLKWVKWTMIILGWVLSAVFVTALTGLVRPKQ